MSGTGLTPLLPSPSTGTPFCRITRSLRLHHTRTPSHGSGRVVSHVCGRPRSVASTCGPGGGPGSAGGVDRSGLRGTRRGLRRRGRPRACNGRPPGCRRRGRTGEGRAGSGPARGRPHGRGGRAAHPGAYRGAPRSSASSPSPLYIDGGQSEIFRSTLNPEQAQALAWQSTMSAGQSTSASEEAERFHQLQEGQYAGSTRRSGATRSARRRARGGAVRRDPGCCVRTRRRSALARARAAEAAARPSAGRRTGSRVGRSPLRPRAKRSRARQRIRVGRHGQSSAGVPAAAAALCHRASPRVPPRRQPRQPDCRRDGDARQDPPVRVPGELRHRQCVGSLPGR